jgi:hypothetical protein
MLVTPIYTTLTPPFHGDLHIPKLDPNLATGTSYPKPFMARTIGGQEFYSCVFPPPIRSIFDSNLLFPPL